MNLLPLLHLFHIFSQSSALSLPHSLPFPFDDTSLRNCLQFYGLNYICRWFSGKYFHPNPSKGSCALISISLLDILTQVSFKLLKSNRSEMEDIFAPYISISPRLSPILPVTRCQTSLSRTSHNQLPQFCWFYPCDLSHSFLLCRNPASVLNYSRSVVWSWYPIWLVHFLPLLFTVHLMYCCQTVSTLPRLRGLLAMAKSMHDSSRSLQLYPELQVIPQFLLSTLYTLRACVLSRFSHVILFVTLWAVAHQAPLSTDSPSKNTGVGCHALLQGSSQSRSRTSVSCIAGRFFTAKPPVKPFIYSMLQ